MELKNYTIGGMKIKLITVGKLKENTFLKDGSRSILKGWSICKVEQVELVDEKLQIVPVNRKSTNPEKRGNEFSLRFQI